MSRFTRIAGPCILVTLTLSAANAQAPSRAAGMIASPEMATLNPPRFLNQTRLTHAQHDDRLVARTAPDAGRLGLSQPARAEIFAPRDPLDEARLQSLRHRGPGVAFMIVGAAGLVTGLIIDESIVTVAGAGVGLYGLYLYLR
jgi:hypothetical protein